MENIASEMRDVTIRNSEWSLRIERRVMKVTVSEHEKGSPRPFHGEPVV